MITDSESAEEAAKQGILAALCSGTLTVFFSALALAGVFIAEGVSSPWAFVDAAVFYGFAWGIHRRSRVAAVLALLFWIAEKAFLWESTNVAGWVFAVVFVVFYLNSIRGTFALHKMKSGAAPAPAS